MSVNLVPNDPDAGQPPMRVVTPRPDRAANRAGFTLSPGPPENVYDPVSAPGEFVFWQAREAALAALDAWENVTGTPFSTWQGNRDRVTLKPDDGQDLNAYYDRESLSFFHYEIGGKTFRSGASTDVVSHETGHGILDALRPDLWDSMLFEVNAFHEAFGDCVALMTALNDDVSRAAVLPVLKQENFLESTAENLAQGIRNYKASHNAAAPRHALNSLQWQLPATLPAFGSAADGPGKLINEAHSFGQIFSGCFYDTIVNIFQADGGATDARLLTATKTAGRLLARAVATAPLRGRFFREIGRAMVKAAEQEGSVANRDAIRTAFNGHGVALGTSVMLAPVASIAGAPPVFRGAAVTLGDNTRRELRERVGAGDRNMYLSPLNIGGERVAEMRHSQDVPLDALDDRLKGVIAKTQVSTLVGQSGGHAAILGGLPEANATADEVETFVRSLLKLGAIEMPLANGGPLVTRARSAVAGVTRAIPPVHGSTHVIRTIRGQKTLVRVRYVCRCHG